MWYCAGIIHGCTHMHWLRQPCSLLTLSACCLTAKKKFSSTDANFETMRIWPWHFFWPLRTPELGTSDLYLKEKQAKMFFRCRWVEILSLRFHLHWVQSLKCIGPKSLKSEKSLTLKFPKVIQDWADLFWGPRCPCFSETVWYPPEEEAFLE